MPTPLALEIQTVDQDNWGTLESIQALLAATAVKRLRIALDPLIDPSVNNPAEAYSVE